jgi:prepilin-type N-terminal cleavage/methylation domain-containing protein
MNSRSNERGYSLLEVLVALTLATMLAVAAFTVFFNSQRATGRVTKVIENRQNSRTAIQLLERDLRMAGSGWGGESVEGCFNGSPITVSSIQPGYGGSDSSCDTLGIIGAWDQATTLTSAMTSTSSTLKVASTSGFATNDLVVVTNGESAHLFQVTDVNAGTGVLSHATTSKYNMSGGHNNWPTGGYKIGAKAYRTTWASYKVDSTSKKPQLVRWLQNSTPQVVAYDVSQFTVSYRLQDSTVTRNPDDLTLVNRVRPVIRTMSKDAKLNAIPDSSWATVRPRSF